MPRTVMVVEDDEELNDVMSYNLTRAGYQVKQATSGTEAMEAIRNEPPDLILLDVMLPGANGWEVCQLLSQDPRLREIPVVIHSAREAHEERQEVRQFNIAGYFTKPYMTADVLRHIEKIFNERG